MQNPTYNDLGEHSETIQIEYDMDSISYQKLLDIFWDSHDATMDSYSTQYRSIIFYHNDEQKQHALRSKQKQENSQQARVTTAILPFTNFYLAEEYHQKYLLRQHPQFIQRFNEIYPDIEDFVSSTATARINGYAGGYGNPETLEQELYSYGLTEKGIDKLLEITSYGLAPGCVCMQNNMERPAQE